MTEIKKALFQITVGDYEITASDPFCIDGVEFDPHTNLTFVSRKVEGLKFELCEFSLCNLRELGIHGHLNKEFSFMNWDDSISVKFLGETVEFNARNYPVFAKFNLRIETTQERESFFNNLIGLIYQKSA